MNLLLKLEDVGFAIINQDQSLVEPDREITASNGLNTSYQSLRETIDDVTHFALGKQLCPNRRSCDSHVTTYGRLLMNDTSYPLLRVENQAVQSGGPIVVVTAGFHGKEVAGPLTMKFGLYGLLSYANRHGVGMIVYPCVNPTGFENSTRYHAPGVSGGNNDFVRYILEDGSLVDDVGSDKSKAVGFEWPGVNDPKLHPETRFLLNDLKKLPMDRVVGIVDLHQDRFREMSYADQPFTYAYVFGDRSRYRGTIEEVSRIVPVLQDTCISAGYTSKLDPPMTDRQGLLTRYDGSIADLFDNLGAEHAITVETTAAVPLKDAIMVNRAWIKGVIDTVAQKRRS